MVFKLKYLRWFNVGEKKYNLEDCNMLEVDGPLPVSKY